MLAKATNYFKNHLWITPVLLGFVLRLYQLSTSSIWHDEGYTMWLIRYGLKDIITRTARDVHPPGYYLIANIWVTIFGNSAFSIRFLSLLFSVGIVYLVYLIVKEIWDEKAAFWASLFVSFSPFMIRFGQEARMYGVVAFFTSLASYFFIKYFKEKRLIYLPLYTLAMIVGMYTQYYSFFVIISLWVIAAIFTPELWRFRWFEAIKKQLGVFDYKWWLANIALLFLYLPWFPVAYKQVTRVGGGYWIQKDWIKLDTIPKNVSQFLTFTHMDAIYNWHGVLGQLIFWTFAALLILSGLYLFIIKGKKRVVASLFVYGYLPMVLVFVYSKLRTPIYMDRYFPFSAIAIFVIWGVLVSVVKQKYVKVVLATSVLVLMVFGVYVMQVDASKRMMKTLSKSVRSEMRQDDVVFSGSLYTFLDGAYYFGYDNIKFLSNSVNGYGETSLFYDQANKYMYDPSDFNSIHANRVWVIGRAGENYLDASIFKNWSVAEVIEKGDLVATLYTR